MNATNNVYDIFSGRRLGEVLGDGVDARIERNGRYAGVLPKGVAEGIRAELQELHLKRAQLNSLIEEYADKYDEYALTLGGALAFLGVPFETFNPEHHDLCIDEEGHCWIADVPTGK